MIELPLVSTLFRIKWRAFGQRAFLADLLLHLLSVALCLALAVTRARDGPTTVHRALQFSLLAVVLLHCAAAASDAWFAVRHSLSIERIRHATMSYVPPTYPIPSSQPPAADAVDGAHAAAVGASVRARAVAPRSRHSRGVDRSGLRLRV